MGISSGVNGTKTRTHVISLIWSHRKMAKLLWTEKIANEEVLQRMDEKRTLISILKARKLSYFGDFIWLNNMHRTLLEGYIDWNERQRCPRISWHGNIKE